MKKVIVVGSGNAFNYDGRAHACYVLESHGNQSLILDFGATSLLRIREMNLDLSIIDYCLITHFHGDHYGGLPFLLIDQKYIQKREKPFTIIGPVGIQNAVFSLFDIMYPGVELNHPIIFQEIKPLETIHCDSFIIKAFAVTHKEESLAYCLQGPAGKTVFFSGDTAFDNFLIEAVKDADLSIIELSLETKLSAAHVSLEDIKENRSRLLTKRILYTHIYNDLSKKTQEWLESNWPGDLVAFDGMVIDV